MVLQGLDALTKELAKDAGRDDSFTNFTEQWLG